MLLSPETKPGAYAIRGTIEGRAAPCDLFTWVRDATAGLERAVADARRHGVTVTDLHAVPIVYAYSGDDGRTWHVDAESARATAEHYCRSPLTYRGQWVETGGPAIRPEGADHV